jgi:sigma-B regulation protein RsbU (phosphoserine phosphatase)
MPGGGVIAIGDVSGHGVDAGLIMLMLHGATAASIAARPHASAREIVVAINAVMTASIRARLCGRDFVTFSLLRYTCNGAIRYAGAHEDILVWRAATGRCESLPTPGLWLGVAPDIAEATTEQELQLATGDLLVLYTDGIIEARNAAGVELGIERLIETVEAHPREPAGVLVSTIVDRVRAWCPEPTDDLTVLVARQQ